MTLAQVRRYALSLPGATEEPHFDRTSFRVKGRIFLTARPTDSHVNVFLPGELREPALAMHGGFVSKLLWGGKVVGLKVDLPAADARVLKELVHDAWQIRAPKSGAVR